MKRLILTCLIFSFSLLPLTAWGQSDSDLEAILEENLSPEGTALVALVSTPNGTFIGAAGAADLETGEPATGDERFRIGSITKTYVATLTLMLQEEGILHIDDLISDWLPEEITAQIPYGDQITLRQLMNMSSGIFNYTDDSAYFDDVLANPDQIWTPDDSLIYIYDEEPYFAPGEGYYYSNTNYNLMQIIIETATGNSLHDELQARIFDPLGMENTELESQGIAQGLTRGYDDWDGDGILDDVTDINDMLGLGDGGIVSTLADMELFGNALFREPTFLSEESWAEMTAWIDDGEGGYGLGLSLYEDEDYYLLGHSGATAGFLGELYYETENDVLVVVFSNNFDYENLSSTVLSGLLEFGVGEAE